MTSRGVTTTGGQAPAWAMSGLSRITTPAAVALLIVAAVGAGSGLAGQSPAVVGGAVAALAVAAAGVAVITIRRVHPLGPDLAAFLGIGFAGAALAGLLPSTPGYVLSYLALAGLGMRLPPVPAAGCGLVVIAAMILAALVAGKIPIAGIASLVVGAAFVFSVGAFTRSSRIAQEQARLAQQQAEELLTQLRASQATQAEAAALTERTRLAREIHDILAHALSGLILALDTMELLGRQAGADGRALDQLRDQVARAQRIARDGLADTRRAIAALRGDELPGPALLARLVKDTAASTGIAAKLAVTGRQRSLPPEVGLALYRTAQEALTNTAKYAGTGACAELRLTYLPDAVELAVEDSRSDGAAQAGGGLTFGGYGLTGMRERAELLGGSLTAGPTEHGFGVRLRLPANGALGADTGAARADTRTGATAGPVRVLIADDQKVVREGLVSLIGLLPGIDVVGAAVDGDDAVRQATELRPDVLLMDLNMPRCNGVEATERLREARSPARVVVLTTYSDDAWVFSALQAGARGFLTKDAGAEEIHRAITTVAAGQAQLDPSVQRRLLEALSGGRRFAVADAAAGQASGQASGQAGAPDELTPRETEVLAHIAAGESNAEIAAALFVSEATVKTHINHIFAKTGLRDRVQLVRYAFRHGLATPA